MSEFPAGVNEVVDRALSSEGDRHSFTYIDLGRPEGEAAIKHFLERCGKGADRYPALHEAVAKAEDGASSPAGDHCTLVDAGATEKGRATARSWVSSRERSLIAGVHTMLLDSGSGEVLASGSHTDVSTGLLRNATLADAAEATSEMTAVTFFHLQRSPEEAPRFGLAAAPIALPEVTPTINLTAPVGAKKPNYIVIGLARQVTKKENEDCDYVYPDTVGVEPDRLVVPMVGTAEYPYPVTATTSVYTALWCEGVPLASRLSAQELKAGVTVSSTNNKQLTWSFPFDGKSIRETASLSYEPLVAADENTTAFMFMVQAEVGTTGRIETFAICSEMWPEEPTPACTQIKNIEYWWHCLEADAQVTLADGTKVALETITNQQEVKLLDGSAGKVEATTRDRHDTDPDDPVMRLETQAGRTLLLSSWHPVFVGGSPKEAVKLSVNDHIDVEGGTDVVTKIEEVTSHDQFCNLKIAGQGPFGFYANGIAVGDFSTLIDHHHQTTHDPDHMLGQLPESHHQDFLSALADSTAR